MTGEGNSSSVANHREGSQHRGLLLALLLV